MTTSIEFDGACTMLVSTLHANKRAATADRIRIGRRSVLRSLARLRRSMVAVRSCRAQSQSMVSTGRSRQAGRRGGAHGVCDCTRVVACVCRGRDCRGPSRGIEGVPACIAPCGFESPCDDVASVNDAASAKRDQGPFVHISVSLEVSSKHRPSPRQRCRPSLVAETTLSHHRRPGTNEPSVISVHCQRRRR